MLEIENPVVKDIKRVLLSTSDANGKWLNNDYLTSLATACLLKLPQTPSSEFKPNVDFLETCCKNVVQRKLYLEQSDIFIATCATYIALHCSGRISNDELIKYAENMAKEASKRNWLGSSKTLAYLIFMLVEGSNSSRPPFKFLSSTTISSISNAAITRLDKPHSIEDAAYALLALSGACPEEAERYVRSKAELIDTLINHPKHEVRIVTLLALDWVDTDTSDAYKKVMIPIAQQLQITSLKSAQKLESSRLSTDLVATIGLCIAYSRFLKLTVLDQRESKEYRLVLDLKNKENYLPVGRESLSVVARSACRYEKTKIIIFWLLIPAVITGLLVWWIANLFSAPPRMDQISVGAGLLGFSILSYLTWIRNKLKMVDQKRKKLMSDGIW